MRKKKLCTLLLAFLPTLPLLSQASGRPGPSHHSRLAQQYLNQHRPDLAIPELQALVSLEPRNLDAQANLGSSALLSGRLFKAEPHLRAALEIQPNLTKIQALLGMAEKRTGEIAKARTHLEDVISRRRRSKTKSANRHGTGRAYIQLARIWKRPVRW